MNYKEIVVAVEKFDNKLHADDSRFRRRVSVHHQDGSNFLWDSAFLVKFENWIIVLTEHHKFHIFDETELNFYQQFERVHEIEELEWDS